MNHKDLSDVFFIKDQIEKINISRIKFIAPFILGFAVFILLTDFVFEGVWHSDFIKYYRILDLIFAVFALVTIFCFWIVKSSLCPTSKLRTSFFPFFILIWAAVVTGIEFSTLGFSTFTVVLLSVVFFLYTNLINSILFFLGSFFSLIITLFFFGSLTDNILPLVFMVFSITVFSVLISWKSYTNKVYDLINTRKLENLNTELQNLKQGLEAKVAQRTNELLLAKEKAEESNRLKTAFLNNISHEIRTPLNSICGFAEFLSNQNLDRDRIRNYSEIILTSSHQLLSVVTDILSISSIETKQEVIEENETDLKAITQELFNDYYLLANEKGLTLRIVNLSNSTDSIVIADGKRIKRILSYLLSNALKFTHNGVVEFGYAQKENTLDFFVKDTGIGIDSRYHQIIFEKFIQANDSIQRLYGGNGLGLSICKGYVQLLGGRIWVESELGRGSTFFVEIPYQSK